VIPALEGAGGAPPAANAATGGDRGPARDACLVDAHVHLHAEHDLATLLDSAAANFDRARRQLGRPHAASVLLLAEGEGADVFAALRRTIDDPPRGPAPGWTVDCTPEDDALVLRSKLDAELLVVRGRQVVAREGIEVLALLCLPSLDRRPPAAKAIDGTLEAGGVPVLPWGFGTWWGRRGRTILDLLRRHDPRALFLGDNGGRPRVAREPALFRSARELGFRVLPGSDPLPLPGHQHRAASYGFLLEARIDPARPAHSLRAGLRQAPLDLLAYGHRRGLAGFVRDQVAMQLRRRGAGDRRARRR
jgi:hypothetical protein